MEKENRDESQEAQPADSEESKEDNPTSEKEDSSERERELEGELSEAKERLQKAEDAIVASKRKAKEEDDKQEDTKPEEKSSKADPFKLAEQVSIFKDYSTNEIVEINRQAKARGLSPEEAVKDKDILGYITYLRDKVAKESNIPDPSSPNAPSSVPSDKKIQDMTSEEHKALEQEYLKKKRGGSGV